MKNQSLNRIRLVVCSASVLASFVSSQVFAAGFEKSVFWSGHYTAIAGAAQSSVMGPEALFWNPAGLAGSEGLQVAGDFSPTLSNFSGNVPNIANGLSAATNGTAISSNTSFSPVGAGFVSYGISDKWTAAVGYYVSAGTRADYDSANFGFPAALGITYTPPLKADLTVTELSLGTGYEVLPGLKLGAAYRVMFVNANLDEAGAGVAGGTYYLQSTQINNASTTRWNGFRLGAEYAPKDSPWGFGLTWRSRVNFAANSTSVTGATATSTGGTPTNGNGATTSSGNGTVGGTLPMRIDAATHYVFNPSWTGFLGYSYTNYSQDQNLAVSTNLTSPLGGTYGAGVPLQWNNMHNIRAAVEYGGFDAWPVRLGYVWTSQVTPQGDASPVLASPGTGMTWVVGTGHKIMPNLTVDGAFEYSRDSGSVAASDLIGAPATTTAGSYTAKAYALHLGATLAL